MGDIPPERPKMSFFGFSGYVRHLRNAGAGNRDGAFSVPQHRRRVLEEKTVGGEPGEHREEDRFLRGDTLRRDRKESGVTGTLSFHSGDAACGTE